MNLIANFFAGAFLCNCIPHLVCGLKGEPFPTPFAKPRGIGNSSPLINFCWGFFNAVAGATLLMSSPIQIGITPSMISILSGSAVMGVYLSLHFGKVRSKNHPK